MAQWMNYCPLNQGVAVRITLSHVFIFFVVFFFFFFFFFLYFAVIMMNRFLDT